MNTPLVSVLMPAYNAGPYVRQAAESILSQTYPHLELLVADDASTDNTRALLDALAGDPRVRLFHNETNRGYLQTTNELFRHCKGGLITFMDADDWSAPARIEKLVQAFERDPLLQCAGTFVVRTDSSGKETGLLSFETADEKIRQALPVGIVAIQNAYNIAARGNEPELELAAAHDLAWVPFFPLGSGWSARPDAPEPFRRLQAVTTLPEVTSAASRLGATASQVALAWLLQHRPNVLLIPGTRSSQHLAENVAAGVLELPDDVIASLDALDPPAA